MSAGELQELVDAVPPGGTMRLEPPRREFQGPVVLRKPITIEGQGGTIWAEKGPVLSIEASGVVLNALNVDVTGREDDLSGEDACAIVIRGGVGFTPNDVTVHGNVLGMDEEEGEWHCPRILRLRTIKAATHHAFKVRLVAPVQCRFSSEIAGLDVEPRMSKGGACEITLKVDPLSAGTLIRKPGHIRVLTAFLTRCIVVTANVADSAQAVVGEGQVVWEAPGWRSGKGPPEPARQGAAMARVEPSPAPGKGRERPPEPDRRESLSPLPDPEPPRPPPEPPAPAATAPSAPEPDAAKQWPPPEEPRSVKTTPLAIPSAPPRRALAPQPQPRSVPVPTPAPAPARSVRMRSVLAVLGSIAALALVVIVIAALSDSCDRRPPDSIEPTPGASSVPGWPFDAAEAKRRQAEAAKALGTDVEHKVALGGGVSLDLVLVPAGRFVIGSPAGEQGRYPDEDQEAVTIEKPFWMGKHEVTQEQWQALMGANPARFTGTRNPVEQVSWDDCRGFLTKLNEKVPRGGFRLPTEAEWEWACRAGAATRFSFGDSDTGLGDYAWYDANSSSRTHPVGEKKANAWGLHDMHGNVWEWCASPYAERFDGSESKGEEASSRLRVLRGGSWGYCLSRNCRCANRARNAPEDRLDTVGFRVVCSARTF